MKRILTIVGLSCLLIAQGCHKPAPEVDELKNTEANAPLRPTDSPTTTEVETSQPVTTDSVANPEGGVAELTVTAPEGSAEAAFQQMLVAFQNGQFESLYDALPDPYQLDLDRLLHSFADKMDPEVWFSGFDLMRQFAVVMKSKKALILNFEAFKRSPQIELIKPHWDTISKSLFDFALGEFSDLTLLSKMSVKRVLQLVSKSITGVPLPKFGEVNVKTVSSDANSAVILYRESKDSEPQEVVFVKVEDKWLPKSIVDNWATMMKDAETRLNDFCARCSTSKSAIKQNVDTINESLTKVQQAQTSEEFNQALIPLIFSIRLGVQSAQLALLENPRSGETVRIEINQGLSNDEQTKLKDAILAMINSDLVDYEMTSTDGKTNCRFTSVPDVPTLVKLLEGQFPDATVRQNADTNVIKVEIK